MSRLGQALLKTLAVTVALLFLAGAVLTGAWTYLFGTKVGPLFNASVDALAGESAGASAATAQAERRGAGVADAGADAGGQSAASDAGATTGAEGLLDAPSGNRRYFDASKSGILRDERTYLPASKSLGGLGLPGARPDSPEPARPLDARQDAAGSSRPLDARQDAAGSARPLDARQDAAESARPLDARQDAAGSARPLDARQDAAETARPLDARQVGAGGLGTRRAPPQDAGH